MASQVACKHCRGKTTKAGKVLRTGVGKAQRYQCIACGKYTIEGRENLISIGFLEEEVDALERRELTPEQILEHDRSLLAFLKEDPKNIERLLSLHWKELEGEDKMKLTIDLVPSSCWHQHPFTKKTLTKIKKDIFDRDGHKCIICGSDEKVMCHEDWEYDDENLVRTLRGFTTICELCDAVKHIGRTSHLIAKGELERDTVEEHIKRVNRFSSLDDFWEHTSIAMKEWRRRSSCEWQTDLGDYEHLAKDGEE